MFVCGRWLLVAWACAPSHIRACRKSNRSKVSKSYSQIIFLDGSESTGTLSIMKQSAPHRVKWQASREIKLSQPSVWCTGTQPSSSSMASILSKNWNRFASIHSTQSSHWGNRYDKYANKVSNVLAYRPLLGTHTHTYGWHGFFYGPGPIPATK